MGKVYKARHIYLDEERAIKVIHRSYVKPHEEEETADRFIQEAKVLTKLRHPNLVLLYDFGALQENTFFMVMEYINGESALTRLKRLERIPIDESLRIVREAALGLHSAHQQGVVHRDISPDNLLIVKQDGKEVTKVIDFGVAKILFGKALTKVGLFMGKPHYCSPEQLTRGEGIDHRADIYSLGATLYYMLTGALPFEGKNLIEIISKVVKEEPKPASSHFPSGHFPKALDRILKKAMAKNPDHRYASMEQFVVDLGELIAPDSLEKEPTADFMSGVDHEFRTRLNTIIGYSEMIEEDVKEADSTRYVEELRKISSAGKHLLWLIGAHEGSHDLESGGTSWNNIHKARYWYNKMEWERAIECWQAALDESEDKKTILQWIVAAETRLDTERQIRRQLAEQLQQCNALLDQKKLLEVRAVIDDAERNLSSSYRLKDLKQQWFGILRRLKVEIEAVLKEHAALQIMIQETTATPAYGLPRMAFQETVQKTRPGARIQKEPKTRRQALMKTQRTIRTRALRKKPARKSKTS